MEKGTALTLVKSNDSNDSNDIYSICFNEGKPFF